MLNEQSPHYLRTESNFNRPVFALNKQSAFQYLKYASHVKRGVHVKRSHD